MILGVEIALFIYGLYAIVKERFMIGRGRKVTGGKARTLGAIALTPIPLAFLLGMVVGFSNNIWGNLSPNPILLRSIEIAILLAVIVVLSILGKRFYKQQVAEERAISRAEDAWRRKR